MIDDFDDPGGQLKNNERCLMLLRLIAEWADADEKCYFDRVMMPWCSGCGPCDVGVGCAMRDVEVTCEDRSAS